VVFHVGHALRELVLPDAVRDEALRAQITVLAAPLSVPWALLSTALLAGMGRASPNLLTVTAGDLFTFANTLAARLQGSVTVEDPASHVLAYSSVSQAVDEPRKQTILGRRVPHSYRQLLRERGIFRALFTSDDCIEVPAIPEVQLSRRVAITVRGGGEILGSIWVAEEGQPLATDYALVLREAAPSAALGIMRHHLDAHAERNLRRSMTRDLLDGHNSDVAAVRLGLAPHAASAVVALEATGPALTRNRLRETVELQCSISGRAAEVLDLDGRVYTVLTASDESAVGARRFAVQASREASRTLAVEVRACCGLRLRPPWRSSTTSDRLRTSSKSSTSCGTGRTSSRVPCSCSTTSPPTADMTSRSRSGPIWTTTATSGRPPPASLSTRTPSATGCAASRSSPAPISATRFSA